jgi:hypothetical protein
VWSRGGRLGRVLALGFCGQLVKEGLGAGSLFAVDGGERLRHFFGELGRVDNGAVGSYGRSDDQGKREGVAWPSANLGAALWAVDHDDRIGRRASSRACSRPIQIGRRRPLSGSRSTTTWWSWPS